MATTTDLGELMRLYNARRLYGGAQTGELEALYKAKLGADAEKNRAGRGLTLQAERDAESRRVNIANEQLRREEIEAGKEASTKGAIGNIATTGLGLYMMNQRDKPGRTGTETPGVMDAAGKSITNIWGNAKRGISGLYDRVSGNPVATATATGAETTPGLPWNPAGDTEAHTSFVNQDITGGTPTSLTAESPGLAGYAVPIAGGFAGEKLSDSTGLGEGISNAAPFGGRKDWNRAAGAGTAAGLAAMSGANPWYAAAGYLATSIGLDKLFKVKG